MQALSQEKDQKGTTTQDMKIKAIYDNQKGSHEFKATLSEDQLKFLLEYALLDILRKGMMIPLVHDDQLTLVEFEKAKPVEAADAEDIQKVYTS